MAIFNFDAIYTMFNTCVNTHYSPFGGNSKLHSSKEICKCISKNQNNKTMEKDIVVIVDWDTDGTPIEDIGLPNKVNIPNNIEIDRIADYLSDEYGFCVSSFFVLN